MEAIQAQPSVSSHQVDQAADVIERHVRDWQAGRYASVGDAAVYAAGEIQRLWGFGFTSEDPSLNESPALAATS